MGLPNIRSSTRLTVMQDRGSEDGLCAAMEESKEWETTARLDGSGPLLPQLERMTPTVVW